MNQTLILIRGLPGSGKSTFAKSLNLPHYEADQFFMVNGVYEFDRTNLGAAHQQCQFDTETALKNGKSVVVSNTFTTIKELRPYFDMASRYGIVPTVITMNGSFKNVHGVPEETLVAMKQRFCHDISSLFTS
jgi:predicted kinase